MNNVISKLSVSFGVILVIIGIVALIPNPLVGGYGLFLTNILLDLVYIVCGAILIVLGIKWPDLAPKVSKIIGFIYLIVSVSGLIFVTEGGMLFGILMNLPVHIFHLFVGILLIVFGSVEILIKNKDDNDELFDEEYIEDDGLHI